MFPSIGHGFGPGGRANFCRRSNVLRIKSSASTAMVAPTNRLFREVMTSMAVEWTEAKRLTPSSFLNSGIADICLYKCERHNKASESPRCILRIMGQLYNVHHPSSASTSVYGQHNQLQERRRTTTPLSYSRVRFISECLGLKFCLMALESCL